MPHSLSESLLVLLLFFPASWSWGISVQQIRCLVPGVSNGVIISLDQFFAFRIFAAAGTRIRLRCDPGYSVAYGYSEARCLRSGQWTVKLGKCLKEPMTTASTTTTEKARYPMPEILTMAKTGNYTGMSNLLERSADVNFADTNLWTPLMWSVHAGYRETSLLLLSNKFLNINSANSRGSTALHFVVAYGRTDLLKVLLNKGADPNAKNVFGVTPLMLAAKTGSSKMVDTLLDKRTEINEKGPLGQTALMFAVAGCHNETAALLLTNQANVNLKNVDGETAIMIAARNGYTDIANMLINAGADIDAKNARELTALNLADLNGRSDIVAMLRAAGAKDNKNVLTI